ncbi:polysaccharide biosynthesis protein [Alkalicella caledoniensis]|uniref:Polysaccharide biosynthesis protein n=1 Tax=Alkalicella caledoniensis TaxID=2731377 RepID=A0A7G9W3Y0_ALKCA|nr:nucleoside-diphosphate sugar epimerase/dehydratase [Alkalicella caledoniensis]QNO13392.1 polysaccharide biosynthesis protein [Alkalicella caledoniensis]
MELQSQGNPLKFHIRGLITFTDKINFHQRKLILILIDILLINLSFFLSLFLKYGSSASFLYLKIYWTHTFIITTLIIIAFATSNLYSSLWRYASIQELLYVIKACAVSTVIVVLTLSLIREIDTLTTSLIFFTVSTILIGGVRFSYRIVRRTIMGIRCEELHRSRVMVIGGGKAGAVILNELFSAKEINKNPVAVIDDNICKVGCRIHGVPVVGTRKDIVKKAHELKVDEIIVALPSAQGKETKEILNICKQTKCKVRTLPGLYDIVDGKVDISYIRDVQIEDLLGRDPVSVDMKEITGYIQDQVVLVTGGGGSIGSELCRQILRFSPKQLILLDISENGAYEVQQELIRKHLGNLNLEVIVASVRDRARLESLFAKYRPTIVFHAAAHKHVPLMEKSPTEAIKNNVFGTLNVAECADKFGSKRFVLISTDKAVNPTNIMGATKRLAEMIIQTMDKQSKTEFVAVRFGNVLGSNGSVIPLFKQQIAEGGPITVTHPEINRYFMTIPEAVQLVIQSGAMAKGGEIFVLDMGEPVKIVDLATDLIKLSGLEPETDIKIEFSGLRPGEKLYEELLMAEEGLIQTEHSKIHIGQPIPISKKELQQKLDALQAIIQTDENEQIRQTMEKIVTTYRRVV